MNGSTSPNGVLKVKRIPRIERPSVRSLADAFKYGTSSHHRIVCHSGFSARASSNVSRRCAAGSSAVHGSTYASRR